MISPNRMRIRYEVWLGRRISDYKGADVFGSRPTRKVDSNASSSARSGRYGVPASSGILSISAPTPANFFSMRS